MNVESSGSTVNWGANVRVKRQTTQTPSANTPVQPLTESANTRLQQSREKIAQQRADNSQASAQNLQAAAAAKKMAPEIRAFVGNTQFTSRTFQEKAKGAGQEVNKMQAKLKKQEQVLKALIANAKGDRLTKLNAELGLIQKKIQKK